MSNHMIATNACWSKSQGARYLLHKVSSSSLVNWGENRHRKSFVPLYEFTRLELNRDYKQKKNHMIAICGWEVVS